MRRVEEWPQRYWVMAVIGLALASRLTALAVWEYAGMAASLGHDPYPTIAQYWLGWIPSALDVTHPPVYSFWLALVFLIEGRPWYLPAQLLNILFSVLTCLLIASWGTRAVNRGVGRVAGLIAAIDPLLIYFAVQMQSEPFTLFIELLFFVLLQRASSPPRPSTAVGLGLWGGVLTLTRSVFLVYPLFLLAALLLPRWRERRMWLWSLILLGWAIPIALWGARNVWKHGQFIPLATNGGWNMWEGFTLDREEVRRRPELMAAEVRSIGLDSSKDLMAVGDYYTKKTKDFILEHPSQALRIISGKFFLYWRPWPYDPHQRSIRMALAAYFTVLFLLAARGLWALRPHFQALAPALALIIYLSLLHSVFFTSLRYRSPLEPFLCLLAAGGLCATAGKKAT